MAGWVSIFIKNISEYNMQYYIPIWVNYGYLQVCHSQQLRETQVCCIHSYCCHIVLFGSCTQICRSENLHTRSLWMECSNLEDTVLLQEVQRITETPPTQTQCNTSHPTHLIAFLEQKEACTWKLDYRRANYFQGYKILRILKILLWIKNFEVMDNPQNFLSHVTSENT